MGGRDGLLVPAQSTSCIPRCEQWHELGERMLLQTTVTFRGLVVSNRSVLIFFNSAANALLWATNCCNVITSDFEGHVSLQ